MGFDAKESHDSPEKSNEKSNQEMPSLAASKLCHRVLFDVPNTLLSGLHFGSQSYLGNRFEAGPLLDV